MGYCDTKKNVVCSYVTFQLVPTWNCQNNVQLLLRVITFGAYLLSGSVETHNIISYKFILAGPNGRAI